MVIVVDDDAAVRDSMGALLGTSGYRSCQFASGSEVLSGACRLQADCLLVDFSLPDCNGLQLIRALKQAGLCVPAILITAREDVVAALVKSKSSLGAALIKPVSEEVLLRTIGRLLAGAR